MWYDKAGYKSINAEKRLKEMDKPEAGLRWVWEPVEGVWFTWFDIHRVIHCDPCHDTCSLREVAHGDQ